MRCRMIALFTLSSAALIASIVVLRAQATDHASPQRGGDPVPVDAVTWGYRRRAWRPFKKSDGRNGCRANCIRRQP